MEAGDQGTQWRIVDVGGSRFQVRCMPMTCLVFHAADSPTVAAYVASSFRPIVAVSYLLLFFLALVDTATWVPFFDSGARFPVCVACGHVNGILVEAIIFLAPISAFDQVLSEDPKVNRLVRFL
jgi:hypothetical protein